jgi:prevent-host-death family protein
LNSKGIEAIASVIELRSRTCAFVERAQECKGGIMIQKNSEPIAVLLSYDRYMELIGEKKRK